MTEYQRLQYHQALHHIEDDDLTEDDREMLRDFTRGMDDPSEAADFGSNMIFCWRLIGEAQARRRELVHAAKEQRREEDALVQAAKEWHQRVKGGVVKAQRRAKANPNAWMKPIFDAAWACLEPDCRKVIGWKVLLTEARKQSWDHPRLAELTEYHAKAYRSARGAKKPGRCA